MTTTHHHTPAARRDHLRSVREQKRDANMRGWGNTIRLWRVCDNAACTAACACRGDVKTCWRRNFRLLPKLVQCWTFCIFDGREHRMTFDETICALDRTPMARAFADWVAETDVIDSREGEDRSA